MDFEFDDNKSESNLEKHGIDFLAAQQIWSDFDRLEIPARTEGNESRFLVIGKIEGTIWSAIFTYRGDAVRIISVRHPHKKEIAAYEEND